MEKSIVAELEDDGIISITVAYSVKHENGNPNITLINCSVKLEDNKMLKWLTPTSFVIRKVYRACNLEITVPELSSIICKNIDSAKFVERTYTGISLAEK